MRHFFLLLFLLCKFPVFAESMDIEEEMLDNFVLETTQIHIPGFPYAFNPSITRWKGSLLLSFRAGKEYSTPDYPDDEEEIEEDHEGQKNYDYYETFFCDVRDLDSYSPNRIGLVWLDENFNLVSTPQLLDIPNENATYRQQDPRLIVIDEQLYIVFSDVTKGKYIHDTRRSFLAELSYEKGFFKVKRKEGCLDFEGEIDRRWEKNWSPFDYAGNLLLIYSITPHRILYPLLSSRTCVTVASSYSDIDWQWGELRGGTPALIENDQYLSFFHSSKVMDSVQSNGKRMQHYFMGAYTFSKSPPFAVQQISPKPIVGKNFYNGPSYQTWKPLRVIFPGGFISDEKFIWIAYGRQDHEIWITKIDKAGLFNSLIPVHTIQKSD
jgi:predicted GH43/DUF377 family glycosyl hydrolase